jgi:hypothetical protein
MFFVDISTLTLHILKMSGEIIFFSNLILLIILLKLTFKTCLFGFVCRQRSTSLSLLFNFIHLKSFTLSLGGKKRRNISTFLTFIKYFECILIESWNARKHNISFKFHALFVDYRVKIIIIWNIQKIYPKGKYHK